MKSLISLALFSLQTSLLWADTTSPDGQYKIVYDHGQQDAFYTQAHFKTAADGKTIHSTPASGYGKGPYQELTWSADSKYLAVVTRGTKTTTHLEIYQFSKNTVTPVTIPDFRLNLLGRHQLAKGGRYQFVKDIKWIKGGIQITATGSLVDGASNPKDHPENWYSYKVIMTVNHRQARLQAVNN